MLLIHTASTTSSMSLFNIAHTVSEYTRSILDSERLYCLKSVPLQHVCCSCSLSDLLASHSSELLSAFLVLVFSYFSDLACFVVFSYQVR